jgi:hypothetical protein
VTTTSQIETANPITPPAARRRYLWLADLGITALLVLIFARDFTFSMGSKLTSDGTDIYQNLWNYWQWKTLFFERGVNPYFTDYLYYPTGINLYLHTYQPLVSIQAVLAQALFGQILGVNLVILLAVGLATWGAFRLFLYVCGNRWGAWLGALIFIWCNSWQWDFFTSGQVNLTSVQWLPFYVLCLLHAFDTTSGRKGWLWAGGALICLLTCAFTDWYYTLHLIILTVLATLFYMVWRARSWTARGVVFGKAAFIGGGWGVLVSPLLLNMLEQSRDRLWYVPSKTQTVLRSVDLLNFIVPNAHNPLYGDFTRFLPTTLYTSYNPSGIPGSFNPGYLPFILAIFAVIVGWRARQTGYGLWLWLATGFAVLALGPMLHVNDIVLEAIKLPYYVLYNLPGLNTTRDPSNFMVPFILALAALASLAVRAIFEKLKDRPPLRFANRSLNPAVGISLLLLAVTGAEFVTLPVHMDIVSVPEFYRTTLAADKENYAILEVPSHVQDGGLEHKRMYFQTFHGKKLMGGQLARDHKRLSPTDFVTHSPFFPAAMLNDSQTPPTSADMLQRPRYPQDSLALLNHFNFRYIVVYPQAIKPEQQPALRRFLQDALGTPDPTPVYQDATLVAYKVPPPSAPLPPLLTEVGQGWFRPDSANGQTWRWGQFGQSAEIYLVNLSQQPVKATLSFKAFSYAVPRRLRLTLNYESDIATYNLPASPPDQPRQEQDATLEVTLKPGNNILTLYTFEQPIVPIDFTQGKDPDRRKISYGVRDFQVK